MRWGLFAAVVVSALLLFVCSRDADQARRRTHASLPDPASADRPVRDTPGNGPGRKPALDLELQKAAAEGWVDSHNSLHREPDGELTLRVLYGDGAPAVGATAGYTNNAGQLEDDGQTVKTDESGIAKLRLTAAARWFYAQHGGLVAGPVRHYSGPGDEHTLILGEPHSIRGTVLMPDGSPAKEATISINFTDGSEWRFIHGETDRDGAFRATVPAPLDQAGLPVGPDVRRAGKHVSMGPRGIRGLRATHEGNRARARRVSRR